MEQGDTKIDTDEGLKEFEVVGSNIRAIGEFSFCDSFLFYRLLTLCIGQRLWIFSNGEGWSHCFGFQSKREYRKNHP
jgi:hypothetical protein